jgi:hypothetical protein
MLFGLIILSPGAGRAVRPRLNKRDYFMILGLFSER